MTRETEKAIDDASARFAALSTLFDRGTIRHLQDRGVAAGWYCLEVGGGGGSIARWLGTRVGMSGHVVVTDIDTRFLDSLALPNVEVRRHDITRDPLPDAAFDLIHTRLVLIHLPERDTVLARLARALKPGGWIVIEEFDSLSVSPDPTMCPGEVLLPTHAASGRSLADRGVERRYGRMLMGRLRIFGFANVDAEARTFMVQAGSPGAALLRATWQRLREPMIAAGYVTAQEFDRDLARLDDPDFMMPLPTMWAAWGRRCR